MKKALQYNQGRVFSSALAKTTHTRDDSLESRSTLEAGATFSHTQVPTSQQIISVRDFPPTSRYLLKNIFGQTNAHSPRSGTKELVQNIRTLFYTQMAIDAKQEETVKLNEYITMEQEKIIEARLKFDEDCDRFNKYVRDVDHETEKAHKEAEAAVKARIELNLVMEELEQEIEKNQRDWYRAEEATLQYKESKRFVEAVTSLRINTSKKKDEGEETKKMGRTAARQQSSSKDAEEQSFFITEKQQREQELAKIQQKLKDPYDVGVNQQEFLEIIQNIEDTNIFILANIETSEVELDAMKSRSVGQIEKDTNLIAQLKANNEHYQKVINEKLWKQVALERSM